MSLDTGDFDYVATLLREQSGMALEPGKEYLVETRVTPIARQAGYVSLADLISQLRGRPISQLHMQVVEALMTNETQFFRDIHPFEALKSTIIPTLIDNRSELRRLSMWCAAASTGQEPYSVAMLMAENFPELDNWNIRFVASDLSEEVLERARQGFYRQHEIDRGLPAAMLSRYFHPRGSQFQIAEQIRRRIEFRKINLVLAWPNLPPMDVIFMRNVLIYLDVETKKSILRRVREILKPDGYLFLGSTETTLNLDAAFTQVHVDKTVCYQLRP